MDLYNLVFFKGCLGEIVFNLKEGLLEGIEGLYFYMFCELFSYIFE